MIIMIITLSSDGGAEAQVDPLPVPAGRQDALVQPEDGDPDLGARVGHGGQLPFRQPGEQRGRDAPWRRVRGDAALARPRRHDPQCQQPDSAGRVEEAGLRGRHAARDQQRWAGGSYRHTPGIAFRHLPP